MDKIRFIGMSPTDGSLNREEIVLTDDLESPAREWLSNNMQVYCDEIMDDIFPSTFPRNHIFSR